MKNLETNKRPVKTAGYSLAKIPAKRREKRRIQANDRLHVWSNRSPEDQLSILYSDRAGKGQSKRQIVRLQIAFAEAECGVEVVR